ncbi:CLPTM1-domain-containing protein, partial [Conidiobolus coronatus NRRL 28638]
EVDDLRQMFFETSPILLLTTLIAGLLHSLFEFLAFQSDVQHWKKKKSMEGTSHASLLMSALAALLNTFYLYDQREDTSLLVLLGAAAACLIELWKVFKSYRLKASVEETSEKQKITDEVDNVVFYWTTRLSIPIAVSYSAYTINNYKFSGYYSWGLDSCMALVYLLGFMNLVPQVVLNHRLKSVESVPIAAFCFRALNTFVDDLFALVIPMPTLTRLSMLRDDLVFFVFLYQ